MHKRLTGLNISFKLNLKKQRGCQRVMSRQEAGSTGGKSEGCILNSALDFTLTRWRRGEIRRNMNSLGGTCQYIHCWVLDQLKGFLYVLKSTFSFTLLHTRLDVMKYMLQYFCVKGDSQSWIYYSMNGGHCRGMFK